jgi:hypothetical protein
MQTRKCVGPLEPPQAQTDARTKTVCLAYAARHKRTLADTEMHHAAGDALSRSIGALSSLYLDFASPNFTLNPVDIYTSPSAI